jgi:hypothetical protein
VDIIEPHVYVIKQLPVSHVETEMTSTTLRK